MDKGEGGGVADAAGGAAGDGHSLEVELTLGGDPAALDQGWRAAVPAGGSARKQRLRSTYFDTGDFRLRRRGFTLRIREDGERLVQTLKSDGPCGAGAVLRRNEWSRPVEAPVPSLPVAPDRAVRDAVGPLRPAELAPAFSTDVMRRTATVEVSAADRGTALVEVALDSGEIRAQGRRDRVSELELELIEGPASALYELAMTLQASAPLCIQTASKAKRGYVLAGGEGYAGCKAPTLALAPGTSVDRALGAIFRACAGHCAANRDAVLDRSDPEGVHQFRVALRRLRSAIAVFRAVLPPGDAAWLEREASRLIDLLGPARDWDVFITETLAAVRAARPADDNLKRLAQAAEAARARLRAGGSAAGPRLHGVPAPLRPLDRDRRLARRGGPGAARPAARAPRRAPARQAARAGPQAWARLRAALRRSPPQAQDRAQEAALCRRVLCRPVPRRQASPLYQGGAAAPGRPRPTQRCGRRRAAPVGTAPRPTGERRSRRARRRRRAGDRLARPRARGGSRPDQRRLARLRRRRTLLACRERPVAWLARTLCRAVERHRGRDDPRLSSNGLPSLRSAIEWDRSPGFS